MGHFAAMEIAVRELRDTVGKALHYFSSDGEKLAPVLRHYVQDIVEDMAILDKYRSSLPFKEKEAEHLELLAEARRLKREIEKVAYELESAIKKKEAPAMAAGKSGSSMKLPRIKLPSFDGEASDDYRGFMDAFADTLSVEPDLSDVKKWLLLRAQLSGKALELVKELPIAPESYEAAVGILEDAYGSTRRAVLKLYQRIQALPMAEMETGSLRRTNA